MKIHTGNQSTSDQKSSNSVRSPWSNKFLPPLPEGEGTFPPPHLRELEIQLNNAIDIYRELYAISLIF
jgi:hypothetical protein